jgi:hypothetical protein
MSGRTAYSGEDSLYVQRSIVHAAGQICSTAFFATLKGSMGFKKRSPCCTSLRGPI